MIRLDRTTRKLGIVLGGAVATNQLNVVVSGVERIPSAAAQLVPVIGFTQISTTNSTTDVDICAAPLVNGRVREVESIYFRNRDTASVTASIEYDDNGTDYIIFTATLAVGDFVSYSYRSGWQVFDTNGNAKASSAFTVGGTLVGGTDGRVLFTKAGPVLGDDAEFTYNATTNVLTVGELALTTDLSVAQGGTGASTLADGGLVVGNVAAAVEVVAAGATTEILVGGGALTNPVWTTATGSGAPVRATSATLVAPALGTPASGTLTNCTGLPVAGGGTGASTLADGGIVVGNGTTAVEVVTPGATTDILVGGGASTNPVWTAATGSGAPARATSPTFVTPVLGIATATSINFGQTTLNYYQQSTFTPSPTSVTVVGTPTYTGRYTRTGRVIQFELSASATTSVAGTAGEAKFSGLPNGTGTGLNVSCTAVDSSIIVLAGFVNSGADVYPGTFGPVTAIYIQGTYSI